MQPSADELGEGTLLVQYGIVFEEPHDLLGLAATLTTDTYRIGSGVSMQKTKKYEPTLQYNISGELGPIKEIRGVA
jgi:hypothetical protein